ncbi:MAG: hypothetical protein LUG83_03010 [Lachnospiraceae bacterium]|nr:hypothetical protein [Lachnospiraceae bacterium]
MIKRYAKQILIIFAAAVLLEVLFFNHRTLFSIFAENQQQDFIYTGSDIYLTDLEGNKGYLYLDISSTLPDGGQSPVTLSISVEDEGNSYPYLLSEVTVYPAVEKSKYLKIHSYGDIVLLSISMETNSEAQLSVGDVIWDAKVPLSVSFVRFTIVFILLLAIWLLRPASALYGHVWSKWQRRAAVCVLVLINAAVFFLLIRSNTPFLEPVWPYHSQYQKLAESFTQGRLDIDAAGDELLEAIKSLENPYDSTLRAEEVEGADSVWDTAYYNGKFYVYFGVVPALIFYLPYYVITNSAFPTWLGVFICAVVSVAGMYYLIRQICRRWFRELSYTWELVLSFVAANSINLFCAVLHADFYYLPIVTALALTLWGLGFIISAVSEMESDGGVKRRITLELACGALCLALTAGCRPQFLVGSLLVLPLLLPVFFKKRKWKGVKMRNAAVFIIPYVAVAAFIMLYNYLRFASPFDFGANYNLTTNDMTKRGFNLGRLPDGIFMYLFKPAAMSLTFPFAEAVQFNSEYLGSTVMDWTFGGAFNTHVILLSLLGIFAVKDRLREKNAYSFTLMCIIMAIVVIVADTEMAGILNRYYTDFLWLLIIPAVIVLAQLIVTYRETAAYRYIASFILAAGIFGIFYELMTGIRAGELVSNNMHAYYIFKTLFF